MQLTIKAASVGLGCLNAFNEYTDVDMHLHFISPEFSIWTMVVPALETLSLALFSF